MQNRNAKCNALEFVVGIFLHSILTLEKVISMLARMGISISVLTVHQAILSPSKEASETLRDTGQTLLVAYAYNNFDGNFENLAA